MLRASSMNAERCVSATSSVPGQGRRVPNKWEQKSRIHVEALDGKNVLDGRILGSRALFYSSVGPKGKPPLKLLG